jgi:LacI family transcriptional regulator
MRIARLADVARLAQVSASIASRTLNGDPTVSVRPETRERIFAAATELDYHPSAFARGLKTARTMTLGMVVPNLTHPVNASIIRGAERAAAAAGYVMVLADAEEFLQSGEAYRRLLLEKRVDGLLIASASTSEPFLNVLSSHRLPFVLVNRRAPSVAPSVTCDDRRGMRLAVDRLVELGHRRIALITGPADADTAHRRHLGFLAGMRRAKLPVPGQYIVEAAYEEEQGLRAMNELLELRPRPTAVIAWSFAAAVGAMAAARRAGVAVPAELSLVAFHDVPLADYLDPPLTTVRMPLSEMAERSVDLVVSLIAGRSVRSVVVRTPPKLVERASVGSAP